MTDESCSNLCKKSPTPIYSCNCFSCKGDQHGSELDEKDKNLQHLQHGAINLGENRSKLGGEVEAMVNFLNHRRISHEGCSDDVRQSFRIGSHTLILGRIQEGGHIQDERGTEYWVYVICPVCGYEINMSKLLNQKDVREHFLNHFLRADISDRKKLLRFFSIGANGKLITAEEASKLSGLDREEIEVKSHARTV